MLNLHQVLRQTPSKESRKGANNHFGLNFVDIDTHLQLIYRYCIEIPSLRQEMHDKVIAFFEGEDVDGDIFSLPKLGIDMLFHTNQCSKHAESLVDDLKTLTDFIKNTCGPRAERMDLRNND